MSNNTTPNTSQSHIDEDEIDIFDILQIIAENIRLLIFGPLILGLCALGLAFLIPPTFTATTKILPPQQQQSAAVSMLQSLGALGGLAGAATGLKNPNDQYISLAQSKTIGNSLIDRFNLMDRYDAKFRQNALDQIASNTKINSGKDNIITISFDDKDPQFASAVANAYVKELENLLSRLAITEAQQRRVFFENQLTATKSSLVQAEQALAASGVSTSVLNITPQTALEGPARIRAQVTAQEVRIASMRSYYADAAPELRQAIAELTALRSELSKAEQEKPIKNNNTNTYIEKFREFKYQETLFELFSKQYEMARIDESREGATIQTIDIATPPEIRSKPRRSVIAIMTTILSGFAILFFTLLKETINRGKNNKITKEKIRTISHTLKSTLTLRPRKSEQ